MEEDDIKLALRNIAAANLSLCNQLISLNASPTTIAQNALGGFIEDGDVEGMHQATSSIGYVFEFMLEEDDDKHVEFVEGL